MLLETHNFEFDRFLLDAREKVLLRDGKPLPITPKAFQLLFFLVKNHGHLVEKDELMKSVWANTFVEEGNITFTIGLLRKLLEDDKKNPRFIETVPRRGYRFIADVRRAKIAEAETTGGQADKETEISLSADASSPHSSIKHGENSTAAVAAAAAAAAEWKTADENALPNDTMRVISQPPEKIVADYPKSKNFWLPAVAVLILGVIFTAFWYARGNNKLTAPILSAPFASEKLSTNGKVAHAVISSDGKNVIYLNGIEGRQSIWLRQLASASNIEIIPPSDDAYGGLALSPDGDFLYFERQQKYVPAHGNIYRVSIFGGIPTKIIDEAQGWISISPDSEKISFVRCYLREEERCSLWIADATDGKNQRKLVSRQSPLRIGANQFAPDGKSVAFGVGQSNNAANEFGLVEVNIESGAERELTAQKFFDIKKLAWLPDQSGLLLTAAVNPDKNFRIWQVSAASGEASALTNDAESYSALSLNKDASVLVSTRVKNDFRLHLLNMENPSANRVLADARHVAFAPNGKVIFSSAMLGGDYEIWSVNADGSGQRQLTNDSADDSAPTVSPDNDSIFFASNRTGEAHVWRMNADGSNQTQITQKEGGYPLYVSLDGKWLYYLHGLQRNLWRVLAKGGDEQLVRDKRKNYFAFSPDGLQTAFSEREDVTEIITVVSLADGQTSKNFRLANDKAYLTYISWLPDEKNLAYILANKEDGNQILWRQPLDGGQPQQIADLGNEEIISFAVAPDGKSFAVVQGGWRHDAVLLKGLR